MRSDPILSLLQSEPPGDTGPARAGNPLRVLFLVLALALIAVGVAA